MLFVCGGKEEQRPLVYALCLEIYAEYMFNHSSTINKTSRTIFFGIITDFLFNKQLMKEKEKLIKKNGISGSKV